MVQGPFRELLSLGEGERVGDVSCRRGNRLFKSCKGSRSTSSPEIRYKNTKTLLAKFRLAFV